MMLLKIKYMAIQVDNYQGGSGRPFEDYIYIDIGNSTTASEMYEIAEKQLLQLVNRSIY